MPIYRDGSTRGVEGGAHPPWPGSTPPKLIQGGWKIYVYESFFLFHSYNISNVDKVGAKTSESPQNKNKDKIIMY